MHTSCLGRGTAHYGNRATDGEDLKATVLIEKNEEEEEEEEEQEDEDSEETERIEKEKKKNEQGGEYRDETGLNEEE